jgi:hypothetical protein
MKEQRKVDRVLANHYLSSTASQGTSNIPFHWFLLLGCNSQAQDFLTVRWRQIPASSIQYTDSEGNNFSKLKITK